MTKTGKARQDMPVPFAVALGVAESYASAVAIATGLTRGPLKRPAERFDHEVTDLARGASGKRVDKFMEAASGLGEPVTVYPVAGVWALWWLIKGRKADSAGLLTALLGSALMNKVIKATIKRPRPRFVIHRQGSSGSSYPSNHISMAFATFGAIGYLLARRKKKQGKSRRARLLIWSPILLLCSLIAWSRVYEGVHRTSDVLAGWLIGAVWVSTCAQVVTRLEPREAQNI